MANKAENVSIWWRHHENIYINPLAIMHVYISRRGLRNCILANNPGINKIKYSAAILVKKRKGGRWFYWVCSMTLCFTVLNKNSEWFTEFKCPLKRWGPWTHECHSETECTRPVIGGPETNPLGPPPPVISQRASNFEVMTSPRLILSLCPANERRPYNITPSLIGWMQT